MFFATVLAGALVAAGCGSDDGNSTASLSKAQFVKQGNAICTAGSKELEEGFEEFAKEKNLGKNEEPSEAELEEVAETVLVPGVGKQIEGLRALGTPEGDEGEVDRLLTGAEEALEEIEEDPSKASENGGTFTEVNKEAREYGLTVCGEEENE
ncbi:MAG TPA: hypothetical protein VF085_06735 [Solirubrobacterales bacterium]